TLAERLIAAGMIVLGKTHTVEFAMGSWGTNTHMGTPRNPWDLAVHRTPGGSSSGSGVAVSAGLAPVAIGTDTGGSVRIPAAGLGARIVQVEFPRRLSDYAGATGVIIGAEGYRFVGHLVDDGNMPTDPHVRPRIQLGRNISARDYLLALAQREEHKREFAAAVGDVHAILTPTAQTAAIPIERADQKGTAAHFTRP